MALVICADCAKEHSDTAASCPQCGARSRKPSYALWIISIAVGLLAMVFAFGYFTSKDPESNARMVDQVAVSTCRDDLKKEIPGTGEYKILQGACEKLETDYVSAYGRAP